MDSVSDSRLAFPAIPNSRPYGKPDGLRYRYCRWECLLEWENPIPERRSFFDAPSPITGRVIRTKLKLSSRPRAERYSRAYRAGRSGQVELVPSENPRANSDTGLRAARATLPKGQRDTGGVNLRCLIQIGDSVTEILSATIQLLMCRSNSAKSKSFQAILVRP